MFFRLKRLAKEAGLKTTQKFSPDYSSILLEDGEGRRGIFDLIQFNVQPSGHEWNEDWYALAGSFQELFDWDVRSPDCITEEISFDPY